MALGKISHMCFTTDNVEQAEKHLKQLGFKPLSRFEHRDKSISSELTSPAGDFVLQLNQKNQGKIKNWRGQVTECSLCFDHIAFQVDDINQEFKELKSRGVSFKDDTPEYNPKTGRIKANVFDEDGRFWIQLSDR